MINKKFTICMLLVIALTLAACGSGASPAPTAPAPPVEQSQQEAGDTTPQSTPITIRLQGAFHENTDHFYPLPTFIERVYELSNGSVTVVWGSGPEAIPTGELPEAMISGIVELVYAPVTLLATHMPGMAGHNLTDPEVMRQSGGAEFVNSVTSEAINSQFLARARQGTHFVIGVVDEISSVDELQGRILRGSAANRPLIMSVGAEMVAMGWGDVYQGLERGVVQGLAGNIQEFVGHSLEGLLGTVVLPGVFHSDASLLISNHTWDRLDDIQRSALQTAAVEWGQYTLEFSREQIAEAISALEAAGVTILELEGAERDEFIRRAYEVAWEEAAAADFEMTASLMHYAGF